MGGAENICRAAVDAKVSRLVDISTCDVFGTDESVVMDESLPLQYWGEPYADSKIDAEKVMRKYHEEQGLPLTMVYPSVGVWRRRSDLCAAAGRCHYQERADFLAQGRHRVAHLYRKPG